MGRLTTRQLARKRGRPKSGQKSGLQPGDMLQDRYRVVGTLGVGGFSSVYQARDMRFPNVTKLCALKEMIISAPDPQLRELTIKSFEREASMLAMLDHPAIPDVSDYFTEGDRSYLVIDLIRGKDLEVWLEDQTELLDEDTVLDWSIQLCDALDHLHSQTPKPIVFRDIKPSNIMIDQYKRIRLIDFGIAKVFETGNKGTMIGTEGYSPPEQYRGQAEPAGDIYATGATLHHLLTRQDPRLEPPFTFAERPIGTVNPNISPQFEAVIMRCLSYDPKDRFDNAKALKEALIQLQQAKVAPMVSVPTHPVATPAVGNAQPNATPQNMTATATDVAAVAEPTDSGVKPIWVFKCEDEIRQKAAVSKGMVFVGAYDNNLYAVNAESGEFMWKYPATDSVGGSIPFVYEDNVFIGSADKHLYCIQIKNGRLNWKFAAGGAIYSSPVVKFDHVFFGSDDGKFYAVNSNHGRSAWKTDAYGAVRSTPFVGDEFIYFGTEGGYLFCLELANGKNKWQTQAKRALTSSPTVDDEIVFVGSMDTTVYAYDAGSGYVLWRFRTRRPIISSPVVNKGTVFVGSSDGNLYAVGMESGRQQWMFETEGQVNSSPAVWDDAVYFGSTDGFLYCLGQKRGDLRWKYDTGHPIVASPIIHNSRVYIGSTDHNLYALPA
ncbi:MAG: serine/threonine-protein kinase [Chloroflexi bacterium]|nr:serine/threonine-protein kinase [Chloroflexota bacterium]